MTSPSQVFNDGASSPQSKTTAADASPPEITVETAIEHARRAFALRKYEQAAEHYATALEMVYVSRRHTPALSTPNFLLRTHF